MKQPTLENRGGAALDDARVAEFKRVFSGAVILPADAGYDAARRIWNASIDRYPGMIARCAGVADVVQAVQFARANDLVVAIETASAVGVSPK